MTPILWILIGTWIGAPLGYFAAALTQAAARADAHLDPTSRRQAEMEQRVWDAANRSNE
jgi:hypothetical protein